MPITFNCTHCNRKYTVADTSAGKLIKCKECGKAIRVPAAAASPAPAAAPAPRKVSPARAAPATRAPAPAPRAAALALDDEYELRPTASHATAQAVAAPPSANQCPACHAPLQPGAIICVSCGLNFRTGERMGTSKVAALRPVVERRASDSSGASNIFRYITIGVVIAVVALTLGGILAGLAFKPLGGIAALLLLFIAFALWATGAIWMLVTAFQESAVCGMMYMFVPFYGLYYLVTRQATMKRPFYTALSGVGVFGCAWIIAFAIGIKDNPAENALVRAASGATITRANFDRIPKDATLEQVTGIFGPYNSQEKSTFSLGNGMPTFPSEIYIWREGKRTLKVTFVNGQAVHANVSSER